MEKKLLLLLIVCIGIRSIAQEAKRYTVSANGGAFPITIANKKYILHQSIGQSGNLGTASSADLIFRQGYIQPENMYMNLVSFPDPKFPKANVYPNTFDNKLFIDIKDKERIPVLIIISEISGKRVYKKQKTSGGIITLDTSFLSGGNYVLQLFYKNVASSHIVIKKK
ncbi:T9SS type A sorting domain-containing protein [Aquimarina hainanensis]|uniref:T9SS type A sorting domain-containing protein n=1 Tax=Aquimarina hainanensis TaxID=1578017 RepID=A0ABW5NAU1_9FLAO|nr:T9SS type A sorting domain-containing protein [Aquimarina sp. TRL1]QKX03473.1 T9SS type A sorting domain-containing protein [Aquimarina sp. TRL1]